jgi:hypothetical protein
MEYELEMSERYSLAQMLVCGSIKYEEFCSINEMPRQVQEETLSSLAEKGYLDYTLMKI